MDISNKTYDVLQSEIYHCSSYSALYTKYVDTYMYTSDQYILITYTLFLLKFKFGNW